MNKNQLKVESVSAFLLCSPLIKPTFRVTRSGFLFGSDKNRQTSLEMQI